MRGVNFTAYQKRAALKMWLEENVPIQKVCSKCNCTERSLWRWKALFDGTIESLKPHTSRKGMPHPNSHTKEEEEEIINLFKENPNIAYNEAYGVLRAEMAYSRSFGGFYNFVKRHNIRPSVEYDKYVPQEYHTPEMLGTKWQMDVKFTPNKCFVGERIDHTSHKYYQYTMIDEATRERFIYGYREHCVQSTVDFVKRAITYFGYLPKTIQTDNGVEFRYVKKRDQKEPREHPLDTLLNHLHIRHKCIKAYTPRHNGKVERSHRTDQANFYNHMTFKDIDDLNTQMKAWLIRYNNCPHSALTDREGKHKYWTPLQKRQDLLKLLQEKKEEFEPVRFLETERMQQELQAIAT